MKPYNNPLLDKKFDEIEANHLAIALTNIDKMEVVNKREILPGICPIWAAELKKMDVPSPSWVVDQFVSSSGISLISSKPGNFKTIIAIEIAKCVSQGKPLFGVFDTKKTKALILDEESGNGRLKKRQSILGADEAGIATLSYASTKMSLEYASAIIRYCNANGIGLVIFDSLTRFHIAQENASQEMSEVLSYFHLIAKAGIAVLIIHHDPKSGYERPDSSNTLRGSSDILAISDVHIVLHRDKYTKNKITVKQLKNRDDELLNDFELLAKNNEDKSKLWFEYVGEAPERKSKQTIADEAIIELLSDDARMFQDEIIKALKGIVGAKTVANRLSALYEIDKLKMSMGDHGKNYYQLKAEQPHD
jgi:hypothetical protein